MRILYLSTSYVPSGQASSIQVMRMCEALAEQGHEVTLVVKDNSDRHEGTAVNDYEFYGVAPVFAVEKMARPSFKGGGVLFTLGVWRLVWQRRDEVDIVFSRDILGGLVAVRLGLPMIFEAHVVPPTEALRRQFSRIIESPGFRRLIVISQGLKDDLAAQNLLPPEEKVVILHDGAKAVVEDTAAEIEVETAEEQQWQVGYVGQLYRGKGMEVILPLARAMPDICFHVVGGEEADLARWRAENPADNIIFHGFISPKALNTFYKQFDILLLPPQREVYGSSGQSEIGRWMSPMKMFEYMSAGKPIVSSDLEVLQEVLTHERNALLARPEVIEDWVSAVRRLQDDPALVKRLGEQARRDLIENYTWSARARLAMQGIMNNE